VPELDSQAHQGRGVDSSFDLGACKCQCIKCPCRGSKCRGGEPTRSSSEAERGGASLEEVSSPRARQKFARVVPCPSSEAEFRPRVAGLSAWWAARATRAVGLAVGP
jgi:hypothetical protein